MNKWQSFCKLFIQIGAMNLKRVFGVILTILGIFGLIYAAVLFVNAGGSSKQVKALIVYGILGAVFFFTGIGLIRTTQDDARPPVK
jgi:uncharacterized membrane protein